VRLASLVLLAACHDPAIHAGDVTPPSPDTPDTARWVAYVGGYGGEITWYSVDRTTGAFAMLGSLAASTPSFLAFDDAFAHLYAVDESGSRVGAYAIEQATGVLTAIDDQPSGGNGPAHLAVADHSVLVANYGDGAVAVLPIGSDGGVMAASQTISAGQNAHEIVVNGAWAFVPCLGSDYVAQYAWSGGALAPNAVPHVPTAGGAGPRHLAFAGDHAYLIDEKASTIMALAFDASQGRLSEIQTMSSRASGAAGANTGGEIAVHDGHVYASNRGDDTIAVLSRDATGRLTPVTQVATGGQTPRHFSLSPDGRFLFVANQGSNTVVPFAIDPATGIPAAVATPVTVQAPTFVGIAVLP
jgi:6-phosphogluconolactonase